MKRLTADGPSAPSLAEELTGIEELFVGAHVMVAQQLGMRADARAGEGGRTAQAAARFAAWTRNQGADPDLSADVRAMVPVFYDVQRRRTKVYGFLGWSQRPISVSFATPPRATILDLDGRPARIRPTIRWGRLDSRLAYPVTAELYVARLLDRDEFRRLGDSCSTRSEILSRLAVHR